MPGNLVISHGRFGASIKCAARSGGLSGLMSECTTLRAGADMGVSFCPEHRLPQAYAAGRKNAKARTRRAWKRSTGNSVRRSGRRLALLHHSALELEHPRRQFGILGLEQEGVEAAAMIDGLERIGRNPQPDRAAERVRQQRDIEQVGPKPPLGLAVRVAHPVADLAGLSGQFATP